jgi:hypothetical protein
LSSGERDRLDLALLLDLGEELAERLRLRPVRARDQPGREEGQDDHDQDRESGALEESAHGRTRSGARENLLDKWNKATSGGWTDPEPVWDGYLCVP